MTYDVRVMWSGGQTEFLDLTSYVTQGEWARKLDAFDTAKVTFGPVAASCCAELVGVRPWLHELWIRQDGETQFNGPITTPAPGVTGQIDALGLAAWFSVRFVRSSLNTTGAPRPVSDIVKFIVSSALSASDPNMSNFIVIDSCATPMERNIDATGATTGSLSKGPPLAWDDELQDIIGTYMHMSSFGRQLRFWCATQPCLQELEQLGSGDFITTAPLTFDGDTYATHTAVYNDKDGADSVVGYSGGVDPTYGILVERKFLDKNVTSVASAAEGAKTHVRALPALVAGQQSDVPLQLDNCSGIVTSRMQPGSCFLASFANACSPLTAHMRLEEITGSWDSSGEKTSVTLAEQAGF